MLILGIVLLVLALAACATLPAATVIARTGLLVSGALPTASTASDKFANNGKQFLLVRNGDASSHTITIVAQATLDGLPLTSPTVVVAAGETRLIGPFKPSVFNDSTGFVTVNSSAITTQTVQVLQADAVVNQ